MLCFAVRADFSYLASCVYSLQPPQKRVVSEKAVHPHTQLSVNPRLIICILSPPILASRPWLGTWSWKQGRSHADESNVHSLGGVPLNSQEDSSGTCEPTSDGTGALIVSLAPWAGKTQSSTLPTSGAHSSQPFHSGLGESA